MLDGPVVAWSHKRMRTSRIVFPVLSVAIVVGAVVSTASAISGTPAAPVGHPITKPVVVKPVTKAGAPAAGFRVKVQNSAAADCGAPAQASPGAVDAGINLCSPSYLYAIACWKSARVHHAICMRNPSSHRLYRIPLSGSFAKAALAKPRLRAPLLLVLGDGTRCSIRDGGAWGQRKGHPNWAGTYSCTRHGIVWAPQNPAHYGVHESTLSWWVYTGAANGKGPLTIRYVAKAYFVGTAH
jgi:hypothetical protein